MDVESSPGGCDDRIAEQAASFDEALAAGREPLPIEESEAEGASALRAAQASLRWLEQVWPRSIREVEVPPWPTGGDPPSAPSVFGRFRIVRELGQGGFGVVFLAIDPELGRPVALKVPRPGVLLDPESRHRFVREARAVAALDHPHIVPLYEAGEVGPVCYLASAYCEGPTLAAWLRERGEPVPPRRAVEVMLPLADAMNHAHERGVLHRDLKPSNVLLHRLSEGLSPNPAAGDAREFAARIIDFGLARVMEPAGEDVTASFAAMGSAPFMAPEQVEGKKIGPATDLYGLGAILYAMLCGRPPHRGGKDAESLRHILEDEPIPPRRIRPEIPRDLEAICLKCLERDPAGRYSTARELADDLGRFLAGLPTRARPMSPPVRLWRAVRRRPARFATIVVVGVLAIMAGFGAKRYEDRLEAAKRTARERDTAIRRRDSAIRQELEARRRSQYLADVRLAAQLVRNQQAAHALEVLARNRSRPGEADLREFTWYHLLRRCRTERRTLTGHRGAVYHVEFSPRGDLLVSAGTDGAVRIWDTSSWQLAGSVAASETEINAAVFSPDGTMLATADDAGRLKLWDVVTGQRRWDVPAHDGEALLAQFSRDGTRIVTAGRNDPAVKLWDVSNGSLQDALPGHGFLLAPDGTTLATLEDGGEVGLYNLSTRKHRSCFRIGDGIEDAALSHDGRWLATAHRADVCLRLWDVPTGQLRHELRGHAGAAFSVAFAPDDRSVVSAGEDGTVRLWDADTGRPRGIHLGHGGPIWDVTFSPDGRTIASASRDGTVKLWDPMVPEVPTRVSASAEAWDLAFSPDSRELIGIGADGVVSTWDALTGCRRETWGVAAASNLSRAVLSSNGRIAAVVEKDQTIALHDLPGRRRLGKVPPQSGTEPRAVTLDTTGRLLAIATGHGGGSLWSVPGMSRLATLEGDVRQILFAPHGALLCTTKPGERVISWDPAADRTDALPDPAWDSYAYACISADGRAFAVTDHQFVRLRRLVSSGSAGEGVVLEGHAFAVQRLAFSPDGKTLASGDHGGVVKLWDVAAGEPLLMFETQAGPVSSIRFSHDGRILAVCGVRPDGTAEILLWCAAEDLPQGS
jgi:WD40 repeat protein/tRNA A-37 threonylcarbamoyl transferase component Bud32